MNEILRFKKGRMIPKAGDGIKTERRTPGGQVIYETEDRGEGFFTKLGRWLTTPLTTGTTPGGQAYSASEPTSRFDVSKWQPSNGTRQRTPEEQAKLNDPKVQAYQLRMQKEAQARTAMTTNNTGAATKQNAVVSNKPGGGARPDYTAKFNGMNFTDEEKKYMTDAGFDPTNAKSVQEFILSKASNANLGARKGAGIADGYWGDKSAAAFQALRNQGIFTPKVDAQETPAPVIDEPVDAPDFGYSTNQDYSNGMQFKNLGFNNFQGLLRYAQGSNDQFAQDLRQRFGDRLSDQAYVEEQLGVSGKYRGGRAGDFGDIARSMQAWKNTTNQAFDDKRAAYSKKLLDARTGASGTVYSSPEIMRKFESIKVQPEIKWGLTPKTKFDFSSLKYNTDFGGASTLGDAGLGTLSTSQKQLAYADK